MKNHLWQEAQEEVLEEAIRQAKIRPVMTILQHLKSVTIELHIAIEILLLKDLDWDLVIALVLLSICVAFECDVTLYWATWELDFRVLARCKDR